MSHAIRVLDLDTRGDGLADPAPPPFLRTFRAQSRRRVTPRMMTILVLAAGLLFLKVWESTVANSLSMERDRLAREVRGLENQVRISRDLKEQAAFTSALDPATLIQFGFQNPDPSRVVDIDLAAARPKVEARRGLIAGAFGLLRGALPRAWAERVIGLPAASVDARGGR